MCFFSSLDVLEANRQFGKLQWNAFSPVCVRMCTFS